MTARYPLGALRHRLVLQTPLDTPDDNGGVARTYVDGPKLWAMIEPMQMSRRFVADREEQSITHRIVLRRRDDLTAAMRLRDGARIFRILAFEDADAARTMQITLCEEIRS